MRKLLILLCVAAQIGVLGFMVFDREYLLASGTRIVVATAPIDPRDPFRGDFVRLRYTMNSLVETPASWSSDSFEPSAGDIVYAVLEQGPGELYRPLYITNSKPDSGVFIRGRYQQGYLGGGFRNVAVKYGIEQYFVEQGSGRDIEDKRGARNAVQTAMQIELAVNKKGAATIADYSWSPLGIELKIIDILPEENDTGTEQASTENTTPSARDQQRQFGLSLTIQNGSEENISFANPAKQCAFTLMTVNNDTLEPFKIADADNIRSDQAIPLNALCDSISRTETTPSTLELAAGETYQFNIDLADPRWHVTAKKSDGTAVTGDLRSVMPEGLFRIVYETPDTHQGTAVWQGFLQSQGFSGRGIVD